MWPAESRKAGRRRISDPGSVHCGQGFNFYRYQWGKFLFNPLLRFDLGHGACLKFAGIRRQTDGMAVTADTLEQALRAELALASGLVPEVLTRHALLQDLGVEEEDLWSAVEAVRQAAGLPEPAFPDDPAQDRAWHEVQAAGPGLRLLAPFWPEAGAMLDRMEQDLRHPGKDSVASLAESLRSGHYRPAVSPMPLAANDHTPRLTRMQAVGRVAGTGTALFTVLPALKVMTCEGKCAPCPDGVGAAITGFAPFGLTCMAMLAVLLLWPVARQFWRSGDAVPVRP